MEKSRANSKTSIQDFRLYLQNELLQRCRNNPKYSLRSFARSLDIDPSLLSKIINGKKALGTTLVKKLALKLGLPPQKIVEFTQNLVEKEVSLNNDFEQLTLDRFEVISNWYHYAILELIKLNDFTLDPKWMAKSLGITVSEINFALQRLQRVELIEISKDGRVVDKSTGKSTTMSGVYTAPAFKQLQKDVLLKAIEALDETPLIERDQTSMTVAIDSQKLDDAKQMITNFRRKLAKFLSDGECKDRVYHLGISLYPVSRK